MGLNIGDRVKVYRNLRSPKDVKLYSVLGKENRVIDRVTQLYLKDCKFIVRYAGQKRVRETGRKNVHAFIQGSIHQLDDLSNSYISYCIQKRWIHPVTYNPYDNWRVASKMSNDFLYEDYIESAPFVFIHPMGVFMGNKSCVD